MTCRLKDFRELFDENVMSAGRINKSHDKSHDLLIQNGIYNMRFD